GDIVTRVVHGPTTEGLHETCHRGAVSKAGAVVDVVRADHLPRQLLHQVVVFVGALGTAQHGDGIRPALGFDGAQPPGDEVERLVPGGGLQAAITPDQRLGEAVRVPEIVVPEAAFHAQQAIVGRRVKGCGHAIDRTVLHVDVELTTHPAVVAGRPHDRIWL